MKNNFEGVKGDCGNLGKIGVYCIYDTILKQYGNPFSVNVVDLDRYINIMINDVQCQYYGRETQFILYQIGEFDFEKGIISAINPKLINNLDYYVNQKDRNLQIIIQTLNYLPKGYFKMSDEQKSDIQKQIDDCIYKYISNYVVPDLDTDKIKVTDELKQAINTSLS